VPPATAPVPESLQASLLARLDRLGPEIKDIAQVAAVIGREFESDLLGAVAGKSKDALATMLDRLVASQITLPTESAQARHLCVPTRTDPGRGLPFAAA
jgi:predicted ATPase